MLASSAKNTVISPNFLVWKFYANRPKLCGNCAVSQNFRTRKSVETAEFFIVKVTTVKEVIGRNITTF